MYNVEDNMKINLLCDILTSGTTSVLFDLLRTKLGLIYYAELLIMSIQIQVYLK